jgi:hypothetical protein
MREPWWDEHLWLSVEVRRSGLRVVKAAPRSAQFDRHISNRVSPPSARRWGSTLTTA